MIKIPPRDLPMVPMVPLAAENVQGFLVTIGKNGTNSTIGRFSDFTIGRTPNVAFGRQIPFKVLPMVPLVMPLVPMVPMLPTYGSKWCRQNTAWVILPTREKSRDSIWRA